MIADWCRLIGDLFFPRTCAVCGKTLHLREKHLCLNCYAGLPLTYFWNLKDHPAEEIFWGRVLLSRVYSLFYYVNDYRTPLHRLKYNNDVGIGRYLGELLGQKIIQDPYRDTQPVDYLVPVPLHYRKKWKRGYNQAEVIAKGILKGLTDKMPFTTGKSLDSMQKQNISPHPDTPRPHPPQLLPHLLQRTRFTKTQTQKSRIDRWHNVSTAFRINEKEASKLRQSAQKDKRLHILLVDDVLTTGATLDACARLLQQHLNCTVSIATLAYVE